jgi:hypothetical protein
LATQGDGSSTFNFSNLNISSGNGAVNMFVTTTYAAGAWEPSGQINVSSNHPLIVKTNNTERMRIDSSGNVIIYDGGLFVDSGADSQYGAFDSDNANGGYMTFKKSGTDIADIGNAAQIVSGGSATDFGINVRPSNNLVFGTSNVERMRIDSSGNVGIGTVSPVSLGGYTALTLNNATNGGILTFQQGGANKGSIYNDSSGNVYFGVNSGAAIFETAGAERMRIDSSGRLGIGVSPSAWGSVTKVLQIGNRASVFSFNNATSDVANNIYFDGADYKYIESAAASFYRQNGAEHSWYRAASGTAGDAITFTQSMVLTSGGYLKASNNGSYINSTGLFHELRTSGNGLDYLYVKFCLISLWSDN